MAEKGFAFRNSSGYVTDGANDDFATEAYPTTLSNGITAGFVSLGLADYRDRSTSVDVRLAGFNFNRNTTDQPVYRIDLPDGTGDYDIRAAFGEPAYVCTDDYYEFKDTSSVLQTIDHSGGIAGGSKWIDATDVLRTSESDWVNNNARATLTFATTIFNTVVGRGASSTGQSKIAYLSIEKVAGGGPTGSPWYYYAQQ